jgi:hypothetical protein
MQLEVDKSIRTKARLVESKIELLSTIHDLRQELEKEKQKVQALLDSIEKHFSAQKDNVLSAYNQIK